MTRLAAAQIATGKVLRAERPVIFTTLMVQAILAHRKWQTRRLVNLSRAIGTPEVPDGCVRELLCPGVQRHYGYVHEGDPCWAVQRLCSPECAPVSKTEEDREFRAGIHRRHSRHADWDGEGEHGVGPYDGRHSEAWGPMPFWPGLILWVRETWMRHPETGEILFRARDQRPDGYDEGGDYGDMHRWRSPLHLPRKLCRLTLEVVCVDLEQVQDIRDGDVLAEGLEPSPDGIRDSDGLPVTVQVPGTKVSCGARMAFAHVWDTIHGKGPSSWAANPWVWVVHFVVKSTQGAG